jgi:hypothetical protein
VSGDQERMGTRRSSNRFDLSFPCTVRVTIVLIEKIHRRKSKAMDIVGRDR